MDALGCCCWALMEGTTAAGSSVGAGVNDVGTNSRASARIIPMWFTSTYDAAAAAAAEGSFDMVSGALPGRNPGGGTDPPLPVLLTRLVGLE